MARGTLPDPPNAIGISPGLLPTTPQERQPRRTPLDDGHQHSVLRPLVRTHVGTVVYPCPTHVARKSGGQAFRHPIYYVYRAVAW